ncbi:serine/threonine-protein kinase [Actinocorallia aurantiaca]|uniref:Protein kinase domain-containing protein n=1 Tax=Actinocorallia aurantiaca TaxID=46204 RepID=A0ABP6H1B2_9ACTN
MASGGERVGGRYRLVEQIGTGGMGRVWRAVDEVLDRQVAVKEIRLDERLDEESREVLVQRASREARAAAGLNHPAIVTVHDVAEHDGAPMIVMELLKGMSLGQTIEAAGRISPQRVAEIGLAVAGALRVAHGAGILHRDLKPANVMLDGRRVVLTDFGVVQVAGDPRLTQTGALVGTPAYMSPEQACRVELGPASDLWSLGATLYTAVEGHPPFPARSFTAVLALVLEGKFEPMEHAGALEPLLRKLLQRDPELRPDITRVIAELGETADPRRPDVPSFPTLVENTLPPTEIVPPPEPAAPPARRPSRVIGRRAVLAAAGALGAAAASAFLFDREPDEPSAAATPSSLTGDGPPLTGHTGRVDALAFHPNRPILASGGWGGTVLLWDTGSRTSRPLTGHRKPVTCAVFTPGGVLLTGSWDRRILAWDVDRGAETGVYSGHTDIVYALSVSSDGKLLASGGKDKTVRVWSTETRRPLHTLRGHSGTVYAVSFHPDGSTLASAGADGTIRLWDPSTGAPRTPLTGHTGEVWSLAHTSDGTLVSAGQDQAVRLWRPGAAARVLSGHQSPVTSLVPHPADGTFYSADVARTIRHWNPGTAASSVVSTPHTDRIDTLAVSPDGRTLASAAWDHTLRLWNSA